MEKKAKKASEFFNQKKNQVSILQWVWDTQFCVFSLLLNTAFICTALLLPRLESDWKIKGLPLPRPCNPWQQKVPISQLNPGFLLWNEVGTATKGTPGMGASLHRDMGSPGKSLRMEVSSAANSSSGGTTNWAVESMAMENKKSVFSKLCSDFFLSCTGTFVKTGDQKTTHVWSHLETKAAENMRQKRKLLSPCSHHGTLAGKAGGSLLWCSLWVPHLCQLWAVNQCSSQTMGFSESTPFSHCSASAQQKDDLDKSPGCWR